MTYGSKVNDNYVNMIQFFDINLVSANFELDLSIRAMPNKAFYGPNGEQSYKTETISVIGYKDFSSKEIDTANNTHIFITFSSLSWANRIYLTENNKIMTISMFLERLKAALL